MQRQFDAGSPPNDIIYIWHIYIQKMLFLSALQELEYERRKNEKLELELAQLKESNEQILRVSSIMKRELKDLKQIEIKEKENVVTLRWGDPPFSFINLAINYPCLLYLEKKQMIIKGKEMFWHIKVHFLCRDWMQMKVWIWLCCFKK